MSDTVAESIPAFIEPPNIADMTDEQYEKLLSGIRERRMILVAMHTQAVTLKNRVKGDKLLTKIVRVVGYIEKDIAKLDKIDESVQLRGNQIRALRLEAMELEDIE